MTVKIVAEMPDDASPSFLVEGATPGRGRVIRPADGFVGPVISLESVVRFTGWEVPSRRWPDQRKRAVEIMEAQPDGKT